MAQSCFGNGSGVDTAQVGAIHQPDDLLLLAVVQLGIHALTAYLTSPGDLTHRTTSASTVRYLLLADHGPTPTA